VFLDNALVMNVKISANNIYYWGCLGLLFFHRKLTDLRADGGHPARRRADVDDHPHARGHVPCVARARVAGSWRRAMVPTQGFPAMFGPPHGHGRRL